MRHEEDEASTSMKYAMAWRLGAQNAVQNGGEVNILLDYRQEDIGSLFHKLISTNVTSESIFNEIIGI